MIHGLRWLAKQKKQVKRIPKVWRISRLFAQLLPTCLAYVLTYAMITPHAMAQNFTNINMGDYLTVPPDAPVWDPTFAILRQGSMVMQMHYIAYVQYTLNQLTPGYAEPRVTNEQYYGELVPTVYYKFQNNPIEITDNQLDFYIDAQGRGLFTIRTPLGIGYTRDGRFQLEDSGRLVMINGGYPVQGFRGDIYLETADIVVSAAGGIYQFGELHDRFKIAILPNREELSKLTSSNGVIFHADEPLKLLVGEEYYRIRQGVLQMSNVIRGLTGSKRYRHLNNAQFKAFTDILNHLKPGIKTLGEPAR